MTSTDPAAAPASLSVTEVPWERIEQFVGQLAHDVRNGLNALELQLTFLGEISTDPEAAAEVKLIRKTLSDVTRQLQVVRNSVAAPSLNKLDYPAKDFFEDLQERFERQEATGKARVRWQIDVAAVSLSIDPETTMSAFLELLANALRFGGETTAIIMTASVDADRVAVTLRETPSPMPAFPLEAWGRSPLLSSRRGAYGIGLFRVRRILESQGGSYRVEYSAFDQTLTTRVTLPLAGTP
jgi:signal transduction histidine kinase